MSASSSVGQASSSVYEAGDQQRNNSKESESSKHAERYHEGQKNSHLANDSKDQRSIANKLGAAEHDAGANHKEISKEAQEAQLDPTLPARNHGNEPSKGAIIDAEIKAEEDEILKKKGAK